MAGRDWEGILAIEGEPTGDGRMIERNALTWGDGPWPLKFDMKGNPHWEGLTVGSVTEVWRSGAQIRGRGYLHTDSNDPETLAAANRVAELGDENLAGLSVGLDDESVEIRIDADLFMAWNDPWDEEKYLAERKAREKMQEEEAEATGRVTVAAWSSGDELWVFTEGRLREVSVAPVQALIDAKMRMSRKAVAASMVHIPGSGMSTAPVEPVVAAMWDNAFKNPNFGPDSDTDPRLVQQKRMRPEEVDHYGAPFTVEDDGRVWGHFATHGRCHGAYASCLTPPDSGGDFSEFLTGQAIKGVRTGPIILDTTHSVNPDGTVKDYDHLANTGDAVADVTVGRDQHGYWVAGRVRPGITPKQLAALKGSALSGEWLPYGHTLKLRGILAVNSPGYLVQRKALAASVQKAVFTDSPDCCNNTGVDNEALKNALARLTSKGAVIKGGKKVVSGTR